MFSGVLARPPRSVYSPIYDQRENSQKYGLFYEVILVNLLTPVVH